MAAWAAPVALPVALAAAVACGGSGVETPTVPPRPEDAVSVPTRVRPTAEPVLPSVDGASTLLDSVLGGDDPTELDSFRQLLRRDSIMPIYDPQFVDPADSGLEPGELVMGVSINGDSRAYPIRYLRWREMVNDEVGGVPILVTW